MQPSRWFMTMALLVNEATSCAGSALLHIPSLGRRDDLDARAWDASRRFESDLERRVPQTNSNGDLSIGSPDVERNVSTQQACQTSIAAMANVSNQAGFAGCYNILDWHQNMNGMFQADLRLYQFSAATGNFSNVPMHDITVNLNYPNSTNFQVLMNTKRSVSSLQSRQAQTDQHPEVQQFSLVGGFKISLDSKKLNTTELMSLLIPQITLSFNVNGTSSQATLDPSDTVWFVAGQFKNDATPAVLKQATNPSMAAFAIEASKGFVMPGTTLGIFPIGLIITGTWTFLFFVAFGLGTLGRIRHRDMYRKRVAATSRLGRL